MHNPEARESFIKDLKQNDKEKLRSLTVERRIERLNTTEKKRNHQSAKVLRSAVLKFLFTDRQDDNERARILRLAEGNRNVER